MKFLGIMIVVGTVFAGLPTTAEADGFPVHGNWCGPGHGKGEAVDALDRSCMRHDKCYQRRGYGDCECDAQLIDDIDELPGGGPPQAAAIRSWFGTTQPCRVGGIPVPPGLNNTVRNTKTLTDGTLDKKDVEAVVDIATSGTVGPAKWALKALGLW